jgi:hypothetical protein
MEISEIAWLAGLLEGEGWFGLQKRKGQRPQLQVQLAMTDEDIVARVAALWGTAYRKEKPRGGRVGNKAMYRTKVTGGRAVRIMWAVAPWLGARRSEKVRALLSHPPYPLPLPIDESDNQLRLTI